MLRPRKRSGGRGAAGTVAFRREGLRSGRVRSAAWGRRRLVGAQETGGRSKERFSESVEAGAVPWRGSVGRAEAAEGAEGWAAGGPGTGQSVVKEKGRRGQRWYRRLCAL